MNTPRDLKTLEAYFNRYSSSSISISIQPGFDIHNLNIPFDILVMNQGRQFDSDNPSCFSVSVPVPSDNTISSFHSVSRESVSSSLGFDVEDNSYRLHRHNYFELGYVLQGAIEQLVEGGRYLHEQGSFFLMNCNIGHVETSLHDFTVIFFCLSKAYISQSILPYLPSNSILGSFFYNNIKNEHGGLKDFIRFDSKDKEIDNAAESKLNYVASEFILKKTGYQQLIDGTILRLFDNLINPEMYSQDYFRLNSSTESEIFSKVTKILENSNHPVSRKELSQSLNYNGDYINRVVKKFSGMTIVQYNQSIQLKKAANLLCQTDVSIADIIYFLGYESRSHFYKRFQSRYKMSPSEFRKNHSTLTY